MRKKRVISAVLAASLTLAATLGGCSLVSSNSGEDLKQVIAEVNITKTENFDKEFKSRFSDYEDEYSQYKEKLGTTAVIKRELLSYFVNVGTSYIQSGYSYEDTFTTLMNQLVNTTALTQYATTYLLWYKMNNTEDATPQSVFSTYMAYEDEAEAYEYLLGGKDSKEVKLAEYSLMYSLNSALDTYETSVLKIESDDAGTDTRTAPSGVNTENDDYFPAKKNSDGEYLKADGTVTTEKDEAALDYSIYTGYGNYLLTGSGAYKDDRDPNLAKKSSRASRIRAYNNFVSSFVSFDLINPKTEDLKDVRELGYIKNQYVAQLESRIINKFYDLSEEEQIEKLKKSDYAYIKTLYQEALGEQIDSNNTESAFSTAIGNMSDSQFILYAPETENGGSFGFVYNILLPFSSSQSVALATTKKETDANKNPYIDSDIDSGYSALYYEYRNGLMANITSSDQRKAWFDGETEYAFKAEDGLDYYKGTIAERQSERSWLFFENNLTKNYRYEKLEKYDGRYSYNGWVEKSENGKYDIHPYAVTIDDMLKEFSSYIDYVLGSNNSVSFLADENGLTYDLQNGNSAYYNYKGNQFYKNDGAKNEDGKVEIDYSKFVYAYGKVGFGGANTPAELRAQTLYKETDQYKVMAAVNELQYAYTTDTGVLSQYLGYSVNAGDTNYIKEFEYAAHKAVNNGTGSFAVCAGDYGWHLIYVTYTFEIPQSGEYNGEVYNPQWENIEVEGTFENMFYEWIKSNNVSATSSTVSSALVKRFVTDDTVTKYESRYQDYLDWDNR